MLISHSLYSQQVSILNSRVFAFHKTANSNHTHTSSFRTPSKETAHCEYNHTTWALSCSRGKNIPLANRSTLPLNISAFLDPKLCQ